MLTYARACLSVLVFCGAALAGNSEAAFLPGEYQTFTQESWGAPTAPGNGGTLLKNRFDFVYPGGLEVGLSGPIGSSMVFLSAAAVRDYLPASGAPASLNIDLVEPTSTAAGAYGGSVLALQLNVDFADSGDLFVSTPAFGDLRLVGTPYAAFNGLSVRELLRQSNRILGGALTPVSYDDLFFLAEDLNRAFVDGNPSVFAQQHLERPTNSVHEPATAALLIAASVMALRRRRAPSPRLG